MFFFLQISRTELTQGYVPVEIWWAKILIAISVIIEGMRKNLEEVIWKTKYLSFLKKTLLYDVVIVVVVKVFVFSQLGLFRFVKPFLSSRKPYYVHCLAFLSLCSLVHCFCCCLLSIEVLHFCFHYTTAFTCFFLLINFISA
jgi:amino acid transporter